jgi:hypothetical protein
VRAAGELGADVGLLGDMHGDVPETQGPADALARVAEEAVRMVEPRHRAAERVHQLERLVGVGHLVREVLDVPAEFGHVGGIVEDALQRGQQDPQTLDRRGAGRVGRIRNNKNGTQPVIAHPHLEANARGAVGSFDRSARGTG